MPYEEGQIPDRKVDATPQPEAQQPAGDADLWNQDDESYYTRSESGNSGRWRYPANFDDAAPPPGSKKTKKKDRWARTEDAYHLSEERTRRKKSKKKRRSVAEESLASFEAPEDPDGNNYRHQDAVPAAGQENMVATTDELLNHQL